MTSKCSSSNRPNRFFSDATEKACLVASEVDCWDMFRLLGVWWLCVVVVGKVESTRERGDFEALSDVSLEWSRVIGALRRCPFCWSVCKDVCGCRSQNLLRFMKDFEATYGLLARSYGSDVVAGIWRFMCNWSCYRLALTMIDRLCLQSSASYGLGRTILLGIVLSVLYNLI